MTETRQFCTAHGMTAANYDRLVRDGPPDAEIRAAAELVLSETGTLAESPSPYIARCAADFGDAEISFTWYPYIPSGDYTVLMADGGTGKTVFCCGIAAAISTGKPLPGEYPQWNAAPAPVLFISAEDTGELLKKRLAASGADLKHVFILDCCASEGLNFADGYDVFLQTVQAYSPRLVVVDPWHAFLGAETDINRVNAVRPVFQRLANLAKRCNCGLILVSHVNKRAQGENANNAATGSADFVNAARSALRVVFDDDEQTRLVVQTKSNYAAPGKTLRYRVTEDGGCLFDGFSDVTRQTLEMAARQRKTPGEVARGADLQAETDARLVAALHDAAQGSNTVRLTYSEFAEKYGADIFGGSQPKRALDRLSYRLQRDGINVFTGKQVRRGERKENGFFIESCT